MSTREAIGWAAMGAASCAAVVMLATPTGQPTPEPAAAVQGDAAQTSSARDGEVRIEPPEQQRVGLKLAVVTPTTAPAATRGFARGLDSGALAAIDAEIAASQAAASASRAEASRLALLASQDQSASLKSVQAARAQATADAARVQLASRRIALEYGLGLARLGAAARRALIADIASGRAALVRIDVPGASLADLARVRIDGGGSFRVLGTASAADPRLQSAGVLAVLRGSVAASATNGRILGVTVERGNPEPGIAVPRDAVLRWRGGLWVYRRTGPETFERTEITGARPIAAGWFVKTGLRGGDRVVVRGAETLMAIDRGAGATAAVDGD